MYHHNKLLVVLLVSVALSLCSGAAIYPKSLRTQKGSASNVALSALQKQDQTGSQDGWSKYVEFYGSSKAYSGVFTFDASDVDVSQVGAYSLDVNFKGPKYAYQVWEFEFYEPATDTWVFAGDNSDAASWSWTALSFCGSVSFSDLIKDGNIQVRYSSTTSGDDSDLDYLAIITTAGSPSTGAPTTRPTTPATAAPTTKPATEAPTTKPTAAPTTRPTSAPTTRPTSAPTTRPTSAPTTRPTTRPTTPATAAPTTRPTQPATPKPTSAPATQKPTSAPATQAPGGKMCPAGQVWSPRPGTTWQWQLTGSIDQTFDVQMYDIDLFDASAAIVSSLHAKGRAVICYFSTQYEDWRPDASSWPTSALGSNLDDWPGERYADIRNAAIRNVMKARLDLAVTKNCDGVEPDNVDSYANSNGLGLKAADQLDFNRFLATEAHKRGLSIGLKNDLDQVSALQSSFDWALNEQCNEYGECDTLKPFVDANKAVFGTEYKGTAATFCPKMVSSKFSWLLKDLDLGNKIKAQCCTYASGGCAKAAYSCVSYASKRSVDGVEVEEIVGEYEPVAQQEQPSEVQYDSAASSMFPVAALVAATVAALVL